MIRIGSPSRRAWSLLIAAPFIVVACSSTASDAGVDTATTTAAATSSPDTAVVVPDTEEPAANEATVEDPQEPATWLDIELTDAGSGEPFTLASLQGQVVALEPMAIWCGNCKAQQDNVKQAYGDLEASGVRYISLGIDPFEGTDALAKYADRRGYEWTFAPAPPEFARAMSELFGPQILSAPSTPLIVLDETGELFTQEYGFHGPKKLKEILADASA